MRALGLAMALLAGGCAFTSRPMIPGTAETDSGAGYASDVAAPAFDSGVMTGLTDVDARGADTTSDAAGGDVDTESCDDGDAGALDGGDGDVTDAAADADVTDASRRCPVREDAGADVTGER